MGGVTLTYALKRCGLDSFNLLLYIVCAVALNGNPYYIIGKFYITGLLGS